MKKGLILIPAALMLLAGCGSQPVSTSTTTQAPTSTSAPTSQEEKGTETNPYDAASFLAWLADKSGIQTEKEVWLTGEACESTYSSQFGSYTFYVKDHGASANQPIQIYSAQMDSSITASYKKDGALDGATFKVRGYAQVFNSGKEGAKNVYEIAYLSATKSPTGKAVSPLIKNVTGGTPVVDPTTSSATTSASERSTTFGNGNATDEGTIPSQAQCLSFDFSSGIGSMGTSYASGKVAFNNYDFNYVNTYYSAAGTYVTQGHCFMASGSKKASAISSFGNDTAFPGKIAAIEIIFPTTASGSESSVSALAPYVCEIGTSALTTTTTVVGGKTGASQGGKFVCYPKNNFEATHFRVSITQGISSSGKASWYNGVINKINVYYIAA